MADYSLGTASGKIKTEYDGSGIDKAKKDFGGLSKSARGAGSDLNQVGTKSLVAGGAIAAGFGFAAKVAIDFEKQISAIGAVSGASQAQLETLRKKALQLGADTVFSASDAARAMEELAKAGLPVGDILNGAADATVALAAAGGVELPMAAELAADAMNSFSLKAQDLPKIADLIAGAANASSISVGDFGQSLKQVGAVANLAGVSFKDTATAIALMGQAGIKGSDAGTSLKTMLSNLQPVTDKQTQLFKELGLITKDGSNKFFDAKGNVKSLADVSGVLADATKDMTAQQKSLALEMIFGSDAIRAAAVLTKAGEQGFNNMATAMGKVTAEDVAAKRLDNTAGAIEQLKGSAETAAISLGQALLPALTKIANTLTKAANWFNGLSAGTKETVTNVGLIVAGILLLAGTAVKVFQFAKAIQAVVLAVKAWTIWSKIAKAATVAWTAVQWLLNTALFANPIGLIILAIIALIGIIVLIATKTDWFQRLWKVVWTAIKAAAGAVADWFMSHVWPTFKAAWDGIVAAFQAAWGFIKAVLDFIIAGFMFWVGVIKAVVGFIAPVFQAAFGLVVSIIKLAWAIISALFQVWVTVMGAIFGPVLDAIMAIFRFAFNLISTVVTTAWNVIKAATLAVWNAISGFLKGAWSVISSASKATWNAIKAIISAVWNFLKPFVTAAINVIKAVITTAWNVIKAVSSTVWNAIKAVINTVWNAIKAIISGAVKAVVNIMNGIKKIVDNVRTFFNQLKTAASGGTDSLVAFVKGIPGKILGAIGNLGRLLYNKGKELIQGLINGISNMIGSLRSKIGDVVGVVGRFLPGSPAKEGPLSGKGYVLKRGQRMVVDFASGIASTAKVARDAMSRVMEDAAANLPVSSAPAVATAQAGIAPVQIRPTVVPSSTQTTNTRSVSIGSVTIQGVWDLNNPSVPRQIVAKLHQQLDAFEKEHR